MQLRKPVEAEMWKIIAADNYDRESRAETLVAEHIKSKEHAKTMADALNAKIDPEGDVYYKVKPQSYKLWRGMDEFV